MSHDTQVKQEDITTCKPLGYIYERPPEQQWCVTHNQPMNRCPPLATAPVVVSPQVGNDLLIACREVLHNNGGLIDSLEGPDTYVMVRRADFELLDRADKAIRERAPASPVAPVERLFEAKLMGFEDDWRIRLCETCVPRATEDNFVIFACALPVVAPASPAPLRDEVDTVDAERQAAAIVTIWRAIKDHDDKLLVRYIKRALLEWKPVAATALAKAAEEIAQLEKPNHTNDLIAISHCDICANYRAKIAAIIERCFSAESEDQKSTPTGL